MKETERRRVETVEKMMKIIGAKWKPAIMYCLIHNRKMRFGELRRAIPDVTQRILTLRLRELEHDGFIRRNVVNTIPSHVEYEPTELGDEIHPFYRDLCLWAEARGEKLKPALQK
jgi:DNA-binding HxlR family transcriptional regulator